jgi:hypothetical protein
MRPVSSAGSAKRDHVLSSDPVERTPVPIREDVHVQVSLIRLRSPLVSTRVLRHVPRRKSFEGSSWRLVSLFALLLDWDDPTRDLSAQLQGAFAGHLQGNGWIRAYCRSR